ncbi:MAG: MotA/TolQ/ExbB proton channel family protein [Planctomycetes bacterium]|nr:MotA/TolQ/ExbB proton channel family protein [Planctomycetota bacterium]
MRRQIQIGALGLLLLPLASAQDTGAAPKSGYAAASQDVIADLDASLAELAALREEIAGETLPLNARLNDLQAELLKVREEFQATTRLLDTRTLDLSNLKGEIKRREDQSAYLTGLLSEYTREFGTRLHRSEDERYAGVFEAAMLAPENKQLTSGEIDAAQLDLVRTSLDRIEQALGGTSFSGKALDERGTVRKGTFVLVGPVAFFATPGGEVSGAAEQRLNSAETTVIPFSDPADNAAVAKFVRSGAGDIPFDATMGKARKLEGTNDTLLEEIQKGGVVMYPIFGMAALALLLAVLKWLSMVMIRKPSKKKIDGLLDAVAQRDEELSVARARAIRGPVGRMLTAGAEHLREPRELIEEVMYEVVLKARLKLQGFLPFIAICAASAPLLGLLGTVTGIIKTFKMIMVFGSGDVKTLADGISEALITTKFGLIVAIPSLLLHAFLSRRARSIVGQMETSAVALLNQVAKTPMRPGKTLTPQVAPQAGAPDPTLVRDQVNAILSEMLTPIAAETQTGA